MHPLEPAMRTRSIGHHLWVLLLLSLPWVQPYAPSPLSNVTPWLISWACFAVALLSWRHLTAAAIAQSWAIAALISSVIGLIQYFGHAQAFAPAIHVPAYLGDAVGNLRQRNQLASLISIGLLAVGWWRVQGLSPSHALWMTSLLGIGLAATASRTGLLQIMAVVVWLFLHRRTPHGRQVLLLAVWGLGIYILAGWVLPWCLQHMTGQATSSAMARMTTLEGCGGRLVLWSNVIDLIGQKPLTGWGWDALRYAHYITEYPGTRFCDILGNAHNLPLHLALVWGWPAAAVVMSLLLYAVWRARPWQHAGTDRQLAWGVIGVVALHSALEYPLWYGPFQVAMLLSLWLMGGQVWWVMRAHGGLRTTALALLCALAFVAYDYQQVRQIYLPAAHRWAAWRHNPLEVAYRSWFFEPAALFAEVTITPVTADNARWMLEASQQALHTSPEPRIILKLLEAAQRLDEVQLQAFHQARFKAAYPLDYERWSKQELASRKATFEQAREAAQRRAEK